MSTLDTLPSTIDVGTGESSPYVVDVTNVLLSGESLQSSPAPTVRVLSNSNNAVISGAISGSPSVSGSQITFTLVGSALQPKQSYTVVVTFNVTSTKVLQSVTTINAVI